LWRKALFRRPILRRRLTLRLVKKRMIFLVAAAMAATVLFMKPPLRRDDPAWPFHGHLAVLHASIDSMGAILADTMEVRTSIIGEGFLGGALRDAGISGESYLLSCQALLDSLQWRVQHAGDTLETSWVRGNLVELRAFPGGIRGFYRVRFGSDLSVSSCDFVREPQWVRLRAVCCEVRSTVWESLWDSALPPDLSPSGSILTGRDSSRAGAYVSELQHELTDRLFAYDIDFYHDVRVGDRVWILLEEVRYPGTAETGFRRIIAAKYAFSSGGLAEALPFFHVPDGGSGTEEVLDFYHRDGASLRTMFLRMPVPYGRVSSEFSASRLHPVLGYSRAHTGIDYATPMGTDIYAVGDGVITTREYSGGYGNYVGIRHANGYETAYGHMSGFASGQSVGSYVSQGQVIGYVGSTGLSTGPHVHFEMRKNGSFVDPALEILPPVEPLEGAQLEEFLAELPVLESAWARMAAEPLPGPSGAAN
jgi:murein DD-endopeptidase MepM/ murein hydrolase activator NlpD